jgi:aminopeptidase N
MMVVFSFKLSNLKGSWIRHGAFSLMLHRFFLFISLLTVLSSLAQAQPFRLETEARPTKQEIFLKVDSTADTYAGKTSIALGLPGGLPPIQFHALDITIDKAMLKQGDRSWALELKDEGNAIHTATPRKALEAGDYVLEMEFSGPFNRRSVGLYKYFDQQLAYLSTQFEMTDARRCFPCFDEPIYKIPFQLTIQSPTDQRVYSNTPELKTTESEGWTTHEFAATPPMPSYLVALAVGPYEDTPVEGLSVPGRIVSPKGQIKYAGYASERTPKILAALEDYFGIPYPYEKLDQVGVSEFPFGAMENAGMVTYRADALLVDEDKATIGRELGTTSVMAHELAHQWYGNLVTMKWWDDLWLNEAFATWMAYKIVADLYPRLEADLIPAQNYVLGMDAHLSTKPIRKPIRTETDIFDGLGLAYNKGAAALSMIELWIGEETFQEGVRQYLNSHRFANAEAADLWNALSEASDKDVASVLQSFTDQSGYPLLTFQLDGSTFKVSQQRYLLEGVSGPDQTWTVPLFVRYGKGDTERVQRILLDGEATTVDLEFAPDWLFPDGKAVGYFRWTMPQQQLQSLLNNRDKLSDRERVATLYNLQSLVQAGKLDLGQRLAWNNLFLQDDHPTLVAKSLGFLNEAGEVYVNDQNRARWRELLGAYLRPIAAEYGLTPQAGEHPRVQELRPVLLQLMARELSDETVIATAREQAQEYLQGSELADPTLTSTYLSIAAREGDLEMVEAVKEAMLSAEDADRRGKLMRTLGQFSQAEAQQAALDLMLNDAVTASDLRYLLFLNATEEVRRRRLHTWVEANFSALSAKLPSAFLASVPSASAGADNRETLQAALDFYRKQPDPNGVLEREVTKVEEQALTAIQEKERHQAAFDAFLEE